MENEKDEAVGLVFMEFSLGCNVRVGEPINEETYLAYPDNPEHSTYLVSSKFVQNLVEIRKSLGVSVKYGLPV